MISNVGAASAAAAAPTFTPPGGKLGKDEFLRMLVAQLRNQDPLNPMKGDEMAAQLAHFSSVEQLTNISRAIEGQSAFLSSMAEGLNSTAALGVIGKTVTAFGDGVYLDPEAEVPATVRATVGGSGTATLRILDRDGNVVGTQVLGEVSSGTGSWAVDKAALGLEAGWYRFEIEVRDANGAEVPVQTYLSARIDGIKFGDSGPVLRAGPFAIPFGTIVEILDINQPTKHEETQS